jgi:membrane protease YdiL (CAAX protease family)
MTRRIQIVIGLLIALGLPFCHLGTLGRTYSGLGPLLGGEVLWWILFAVILAYTLLVERKSLSTLGFRRPGVWDIALGILAGVVMFMGIGMIFQFVLPALHLEVNQHLNTLLSAPLWFRLLTVTRAALVEETAFRGYGFERIAEWTGGPLLAGLATWALFTIAHLQSWGWGQVIIAAYGGLVLTILYIWWRNLWANIIAHWITDGAGFLLVPFLIAHH